jgi:predicted XRE-type DNA-binding protein
MKSASRENKPAHVTQGDVFDDLGFSPAETLEAKIKADIWQALIQHIEEHGFSQASLANTLKAHQPDVSNLLKGKISKISITKLIQYARRLNLGARVTVTSPQAGKSTAAVRAESSHFRRGRKRAPG